jgi:exopolysaccharide biosynthesis polyprenyl glycosylphosphotransferase
MASEARGPVSLRGRGWLVRRALLCADVVGLVGAFTSAQILYGVPDSSGALGRFGSQQEYLIFLATLPAWVLVAKTYRLYSNDEERTDHSTLDEFVGIFHVVTLGVWAFFALSWLTGLASPQFLRLFAFWSIAILLVSAGRATARAVCRRRPSYVQRAIIVGCGDVGQVVARKFLNHPEYGVDVVGFVDADPRARDVLVDRVPVIGAAADLPAILSDRRIDRVIIAFSGDSHDATLDLLRSLRGADIQVDIVPRLFEILGANVQSHQVEGMAMLAIPTARLSRSDHALKRAFDIVGAVAGLIAMAPLLALIATAIKIDSRGPVFFRQMRIGADDVPFRIWKFRSMVSGAEARRAEVAHLNRYAVASAAPVMFKVTGDPRITRVGRWLRQTSLDELPQLFNVIDGSMSLVGPRPLVPSEDVEVRAWGRERLSLRPGMTGPWQVAGRNDIPFAEMIRLDVGYVHHWSLARDVSLILRTAILVVTRRGPESQPAGSRP